MFCGFKSYVFECCFRHSHSPTIVLPLVFFVLSMIRFSKSAQKSAVQVCQIATDVMETKQLVLSQFKNFYQ